MNETFIAATQAQVFSLPRDVLPINPFVLPSYDPMQVKFSAEEKAESFASFDRGLGPLQKGKFSRAVEQAYEARRQAGSEPYPDFRDINQQVRSQYEEGDEDKLTEILRRLTDFGLFWDHQSSQELYDTLHDKVAAASYYHHFLEASAGKFPNQEWQARQRLKLLEGKQ